MADGAATSTDAAATEQVFRPTAAPLTSLVAGRCLPISGEGRADWSPFWVAPNPPTKVREVLAPAPAPASVPPPAAVAAVLPAPTTSLASAASASAVSAPPTAAAVAATAAASSFASMTDIFRRPRLDLTDRFHLIPGDGQVRVVEGAGGKQSSATFSCACVFELLQSGDVIGEPWVGWT